MQPGSTHAHYLVVGRMSDIVYVIIFCDGRLGSLKPGVENHYCTMYCSAEDMWQKEDGDKGIKVVDIAVILLADSR